MLLAGNLFVIVFCINVNDELGAKIFNAVSDIEKKLPQIVEPKNISEHLAKLVNE